ncbi:MAG: ribose 5-phosphate isomerase B [Coriobacteriales bacterium]|jgi:ribose 5-phosphate isomerase B
MRIAIGNDHAGFEMKAQLSDFIESLGHEVEDLGCYSSDRVDYPDYAAKVGHTVMAGDADMGILICGTGIGMCIAANKVHGIRAANVTNPEIAPFARAHNNANVLTLSARFVDVDTNKEIIKRFLETDFEGGRHAGRVDKISALDDERL